MNKEKILRVTTIPLSLKLLLTGQLSFISKHFEVKAISSGPSIELEDIASREGVEVLEVNMTRTISPLKDMVALINMIRVFKKEKPFIVHTHTPKAGLIGIVAARIANVPVRLHTVAGLPLMETSGLKRILLDSVEKVIYYYSTRVYPNSMGMYNFIIKNKLTKQNKLKVIANGSSNGIDTEYYSPNSVSDEQKVQLKKQLNIINNEFVYVFVGRLVKDKGLNELIKVFSKFNHLNIKLLLVGNYENELDPLFPETLIEISQNSNIISVGFQRDVRPLFAISDCLVFPSYREGFPNVVMQAGAMQLPSIVTDINGCNEIIEEGVNGTIIPPKSIIELEKAMLKMFIDIEWHQKLQCNARNMIVSKYNQLLVWNGLLNQYQQFLENAK